MAVVEPPSALPDGLLVASCLINLPTRRSSSLPVVVKNETEHDIIIPPRTVLAELSAIQSVMKNEQTGSQPNSSDAPETPQPSKLNFNFRASPLPANWKERVTKKLNSMPEVFSQQDLDFGCTDKVKHHIKLHDETPFKQCARPIHPRDLDALCKHLQELLESGVLR